MSGEKERGPVYGVELVDRLPIGGMLQQMPSRQDLEYVRQFSERTVAGYEVLLALAQRMAHALQDVAGLIDETHGVYGLHRNGDNAPWEELLKGGQYGEWLDRYSDVDKAAIAMLLSDEVKE